MIKNQQTEETNYSKVLQQQDEKESQALKKITLSYDEKPGIQAIENFKDDLFPVKEKAGFISRDTDYIRHGSLTLMAAMDLHTGVVHHQCREKFNSEAFIEFLKELDKIYPFTVKIRIILDNHTTHYSKKTRTYLNDNPNRFEFVFTPKHGSWLNIIEKFFSKMARTILRGIRVKSKDELKNRIRRYIERINLNPVLFKWKYQLNSPLTISRTITYRIK
jgi:transposase